LDPPPEKKTGFEFVLSNFLTQVDHSASYIHPAKICDVLFLLEDEYKEYFLLVLNAHGLK
jgi:hypothetical protein